MRQSKTEFKIEWVPTTTDPKVIRQAQIEALRIIIKDIYESGNIYESNILSTSIS